MSWPRGRMRPASGERAPAIRLKSVVLPDPFGPMIPSSSPSSSVKLTSWTARTPPKPFDTRSTSRRGMERLRPRVQRAIAFTLAGGKRRVDFTKRYQPHLGRLDDTDRLAVGQRHDIHIADGGQRVATGGELDGKTGRG